LELPIDAVSLAHYLIGKLLARELPESVASGRIAETEAYVADDAAGHAYRGIACPSNSAWAAVPASSRASTAATRLLSIHTSSRQ
jgi:3-methyladenine DNA glycosylase Mpg